MSFWIFGDDTFEFFRDKYKKILTDKAMNLQIAFYIEGLSKYKSDTSKK